MIQQGARAKSISFTQVGSGGPTSPINSIQSYSFSRADELAEFLKGNARVQSHYKGTSSASIQIETADLAAWAAANVGQKFTAVVLTIEGAVDSAGVAVGDDITITLSEAVITEVGELSKDNADSAPVTGSITFTLSRHATSTADPTYTIAAAGGGGS